MEMTNAVTTLGDDSPDSEKRLQLRSKAKLVDKYRNVNGNKGVSYHRNNSGWIIIAKRMTCVVSKQAAR